MHTFCSNETIDIMNPNHSHYKNTQVLPVSQSALFTVVDVFELDLRSIIYSN
jgi:predicted nucleic acid-binding Zn ribbon protein